MSTLVVGSVAFDSVKTPFGSVDQALGGSATYFSVAASKFTDVNLVAVVGEDFTEEHESIFRGRPIDTSGLQKVPGKTFRWKGEYTYDLNEARTLDTQLNVFQSFSPEVPEHFKGSDIVFLANIDPDLQQEVLNQVKKPKLVACDTMNFWIESKPDALKKLIKRVDLLIINEGEARQFAGESNLVKAVRRICSWGPKSLIIKRGEYGAFLYHEDEMFIAPGYPLEAVFDPTGAGDSFAGGVIGYLDQSNEISGPSLRRAVVMGGAMASFTVESFSLEKLAEIDSNKVRERFDHFKHMTHFDEI